MNTDGPTILRLPAVLAATGLSKTTVWRLTKRGGFPQPVKLSARCVGWRASKVEAWLADRPRAGPHEQEPPGVGPGGSERSPCHLSREER
ncbi:MAG: AlpA family phage regulatory protein [Actinomycetia bacterium]|nr:AlpA family phage regulatory protein [Actinomycetes bacterium]